MIEKLTALKRHTGFVKYFKNTSWLFVEKLFRMVIGLFVGVWLARYLGPEQYGIWSYAGSLVGIFAVLASLGLDGIVVRDLIRMSEEERHLLVGTAFFLKLVGAVLMMSVLVSTVYFVPDHHANLLIFIFASASFLQSFGVINLYFQSRVLSKFVAYVNSGAFIASSLLKIVLILMKAPLIALACTVVFESIVMAAGFGYFYAKQGHLFMLWTFNRTLAKRLIRDSWPMIFSGMVVAIYMKIDQIMIMEMLDSASVGQYAVAVRLSEVWYFIPVVIATSLFPAIVNARHISRELYLARLQKLYDLMAWMGIVVALIMTFASNMIVSLLYGMQYNHSGGVLAIHIWAGVFVFLGVAYSKFLVAENFTKKSLYMTSVGMVVNVVLNYLLIPVYGINGAAIATFVGQMTANVVYDVFDADLRQQFRMKLKSLFPMHILITRTRKKGIQ